MPGLGVTAVLGDQISHLQAGGLHPSLLSREHQGITMAKMRALIHQLQQVLFLQKVKGSMALSTAPPPPFFFLFHSLKPLWVYWLHT